MNILIVVDMQNDFVSGALGTREAVDIVPRVAERVAAGADLGETILFTRDTHEENYLETREGRALPVPHCIRGTEGWEIIDQLTEYTVDRTVVDKPTFGSRELGRILAAEQEPVEKITFIGLCTDICVISNAMLAKAALPEVPIYVDPHCCAGVSPASHGQALAAMQVCQIHIED